MSTMRPILFLQTPRLPTPHLHHHVPKCALPTLPPLPTLALSALFSHSRVIPAVIRGPASSYLLATLLKNIHLIPHSPLYNKLLSTAPLAISLLLLRRSKAKPSSSLTTAFIIGACGTAIGALLATFLSPLPAQIVCRLAAAFAATYIGGTANFVAVADALSLPAEIVAAAITVDLALMAAYMSILFAISSTDRGEDVALKEDVLKESPWTVFNVVIPLCVALTICGVSSLVSRNVSVPGGSILLTTILSLLLSKEGRLQKHMSHSGRLADGVLSLFFGALGATCSFDAVMKSSPAVMLFGAIVLIVHAVAMYVVGHRWFGISGRELSVASNANIGGASTAAAFAAAMGWERLVASGVALGIIGYVVGTPIGLAIFRATALYLNL